MSFLQRLFADQLLQDTREPALSFDSLGYHVGVLAPNYQFFVQIMVVRTTYLRMNRCLRIRLWGEPDENVAAPFHPDVSGFPAGGVVNRGL